MPCTPHLSALHGCLHLSYCMSSTLQACNTLQSSDLMRADLGCGFRTGGQCYLPHLQGLPSHSPGPLTACPGQASIRLDCECQDKQVQPHVPQALCCYTTSQPGAGRWCAGSALLWSKLKLAWCLPVYVAVLPALRQRPTEAAMQGGQEEQGCRSDSSQPSIQAGRPSGPGQQILLPAVGHRPGLSSAALLPPG